MNGRIVRIAALTVGIALVAACAGGTAATAEPIAEATTAVTAAPTLAPTAIPTATPKPTPTPEPTPDLAAIGAAYLALADRFNEAATPAFDELAAREHIEKEYIALNKQIVVAYQQAIDDLDAIEFPPEITDEIAGIRSSWERIRDLFQQIVSDPSTDIDAEFEAEAAAYGKLADAVRAALGLPPRPTNPPD